MGTGALMSIRTSVFEKRVPVNEGLYFDQLALTRRLFNEALLIMSLTRSLCSIISKGISACSVMTALTQNAPLRCIERNS